MRMALDNEGVGPAYYGVQTGDRVNLALFGTVHVEELVTQNDRAAFTFHTPDNERHTAYVSAIRYKA